MLFFAWLESLFLHAVIWYYIFIVLSIIIFINSIIGFIVVIQWFRSKGTTKGYSKKNKSGLSEDEYKWLHNK